MLILGVETSTARGCVALYDTDSERALAEHVFPDKPSHARDIVPAVDHIITSCNVQKTDVDAVAVSQGPGSFTGLRVGVTCVKTLAYILPWECVGVPSLEVMVHNINPEATETIAACPLRDARRSAVYGTLYRCEEGHWVDHTGVMLSPPAHLAERLPNQTLVFGNGVSAYSEIFNPEMDGRFQVGPTELARPSATNVARLGARKIAEGDAVSPMELNPRYYRKTAAEDNLNINVG